MTSKRPYLLRALHEWMTDNAETPLIVVDASHPGVQAPGEYVEAGKLILNISYSATSSLLIGNDCVTFSARFDGRPMDLYIPEDALLGIYARESGEGMIFALTEDEIEVSTDADVDDDAIDNNNDEPPKPSRPKLKVVK